jgi:hypothetical protein
MTQPVPKGLRDRVIREYLKGKSRNEIAKLTGLGAGTVTNIIQDWRQQVAEYEPEKITELAVELRKMEISADDCVRRTRMINKMRELDIDEDKFLALVEDSQARSIEKGIPPERCGELMSQLFAISQDELVPLDELPDHLRSKIQEIDGIETRLRDNNLSHENIKFYISLKKALAEIGISDTDIDRVVNVIRNVKAQDFDANKMVQIISSIIPLEQRIEIVKNEFFVFQDLIPFLRAIRDVGGLAVAPSGLCMLLDCIAFRAMIDRVSSEVAAHKIKVEIEQMYRIVGFEKEIQTKQLEVQTIEHKREELKEFWESDLQAIDALVYLNARGVTRDHIAIFTTFFRGNQGKIKFATFNADLNKYGNFKSVLTGLEEKIARRKEEHELFEEYLKANNASVSLQELTDLRIDRISARNELESAKDELDRLKRERNSLRGELAAIKEIRKEKNSGLDSSHGELAGKEEQGNDATCKELSPATKNNIDNNNNNKVNGNNK